MPHGPLSDFRTAARACAAVMYESAGFITQELSSVEATHPYREAIKQVCDAFVSNWHDIGTELDELSELGLPDYSPTVLARVDRIHRWLGEVLPALNDVVQALSSAAKDDPRIGSAYILVAESATNVLHAFADVSDRRDAYLRAFEASTDAANAAPRLLFASTTALEHALDGSDQTFERYFFALYHCSPDDDNDLNSRRASVRSAYPEKSTAVGRHFVLFGEAAFQIVSAYYQALSINGKPDSFREYAAARHTAILRKHRSSQALPTPIDLSEGQLCEDPDLDFFACLAISNGQILAQPPKRGLPE